MDGGSGLYHLPGFYEPFNAISHLLAVMVFVGALFHWRFVWKVTTDDEIRDGRAEPTVGSRPLRLE